MLVEVETDENGEGCIVTYAKGKKSILLFFERDVDDEPFYLKKGFVMAYRNGLSCNNELFSNNKATEENIIKAFSWLMAK